MRDSRNKLMHETAPKPRVYRRMCNFLGVLWMMVQIDAQGDLSRLLIRHTAGQHSVIGAHNSRAAIAA